MLLLTLLLSFVSTWGQQNLCGDDIPPPFQQIGGTFFYKPPDPNFNVTYVLCRTLDGISCGLTKYEKCVLINHTFLKFLRCRYRWSNCCGACQSFTVGDQGYKQECLGGLFKKAWQDSEGVYNFLYDFGDDASEPIPGPRQFLVSVTCGTEKWKEKAFVPPNPNTHKPGDPFLFTLQATSIYACPCTDPYFNTCTRCTNQWGCEWCMDSSNAGTGTCLSKSSTCENYIRAPAYCPCTGQTCHQCLAVPNCAWCLGQGQGCYDADANCVDGRVTNPAFCPPARPW